MCRRQRAQLTMRLSTGASVWSPCGRSCRSHWVCSGARQRRCSQRRMLQRLHRCLSEHAQSNNPEDKVKLDCTYHRFTPTQFTLTHRSPSPTLSYIVSSVSSPSWFRGNLLLTCKSFRVLSGCAFLYVVVHDRSWITMEICSHRHVCIKFPPSALFIQRLVRLVSLYSEKQPR